MSIYQQLAEVMAKEFMESAIHEVTQERALRSAGLLGGRKRSRNLAALFARLRGTISPPELETQPSPKLDPTPGQMDNLRLRVKYNSPQE